MAEVKIGTLIHVKGVIEIIIECEQAAGSRRASGRKELRVGLSKLCVSQARAATSREH